ncbi:hypothetical protein TNCV_1599621 [Trichonephila clavipes]|nr:hypothetical protein TNCV_1599621 [Trichonephila clavipes]
MIDISDFQSGDKEDTSVCTLFSNFFNASFHRSWIDKHRFTHHCGRYNGYKCGRYTYASALADHVHPYEPIVFPQNDDNYQHDNAECHRAGSLLLCFEKH